MKVIIMGDWNVRVGDDTSKEYFPRHLSLGKYSEITLNVSERKIIKLCVVNDLKIGNSVVK